MRLIVSGISLQYIAPITDRHVESSMLSAIESLLHTVFAGSVRARTGHPSLVWHHSWNHGAMLHVPVSYHACEPSPSGTRGEKHLVWSPFFYVDAVID